MPLPSKLRELRIKDTRSMSIEHNSSLMMENLYLGGNTMASNLGTLKQFGVTHVINCCSDKNYFPEDITYLSLDLGDDVDQPIIQEFERVFDFIDRARNNHSACLVFCQYGMSRSASLVLAYVMKHRGMSLLEAFNYAKQRRPLVSPNTGFMRQLIEFEQTLRGGEPSIDLERYRENRFGEGEEVCTR